MPSPTFTLIASSTVGSGGAASIDFTSIPSTYTDLVIKLSIRSTNAAGNWDPCKMKINGATTNFGGRLLYGTGSAAASETEGGTDPNVYGYTSNANNTANTFGNLEVYIPNYTSTTAAKSISTDAVGENNATAALASISAQLWNPGTSVAITSLSFYPYGGSYAQYSTAYLYGVKNS